MKQTPGQIEKYCQFLHATLIEVGKVCPEIKMRNDSVVVKTNNSVLLSSTSKSISSPYQEIIEAVLNQPGDLIDEDEYMTPVQISNLLTSLAKKGEILRLNHIGFCYRTSDVNKSIARICDISKTQSLHVYQLESEESIPWIFTGLAKTWREPTLEFLPVKSTFTSRDMDW